MIDDADIQCIFEAGKINYNGNDQASLSLRYVRRHYSAYQGEAAPAGTCVYVPSSLPGQRAQGAGGVLDERHAGASAPAAAPRDTPSSYYYGSPVPSAGCAGLVASYFER